jgi:predicted RNA binding protein YcfA (HicA-like mRNA interferase family)
MTKKKKLIQKLLGMSKNISFADAQSALEIFGFKLSRTSGSHYIYVHPQISELVNLQNVNGKAKPYQIRQFLEIIERYNLGQEEEV